MRIRGLKMSQNSELVAALFVVQLVVACLYWWVSHTAHQHAHLHNPSQARIFVGVFSGPDRAQGVMQYSSRRALLRSTWFPSTRSEIVRARQEGITFRFVVGVVDGAHAPAIQAEARRFDDFLFLNVSESYGNLAQKSLVYFEHVFRLGLYDYAIKVDDDVFLSAPHLLKAVGQWQSMGADYIGCMHAPGPEWVFKEKGHKYYEPRHDLFPNGYHLYASGPIYALSHSAMYHVFGDRKTSNRLLRSEDTSIGLWMLAHSVVHFDDRRLCARSCYPSGAFIAVNGQVGLKCGGLCSPHVELPALFGRAECRSPPPLELPFTRANFEASNEMILNYTTQRISNKHGPHIQPVPRR